MFTLAALQSTDSLVISSNFFYSYGTAMRMQHFETIPFFLFFILNLLILSSNFSPVELILSKRRTF